jgi:HEAT repeat protein
VADTALAGVRLDPNHVGLTGALVLVILVVVPIAVGALAGFAGWEAAHLVELAAYQRRLHTYLERRLQRQAPLERLGFRATGLPFGADGRPREGDEQPLAALLAKLPGTLLLGEAGIGKTTALQRYAHTLSQPGALLSLALGQAPLPVLVPLASYAAAPAENGGPRLGAVLAQVRAFGPARLAAHLLAAPHHWRIVLLLDGLEDVPAVGRKRIVAEIAQLLTTPPTRLQVVITCGLSTYLEDPAAYSSLGALNRVIATGAREGDVATVLRQAARTTRVPGQTADGLLVETQSRGLGAQVGHPETLVALLALRAARAPVPRGRGRLLAAYADLLCRQAAARAVEAGPLIELLGQLACALRDSGAAFVPLGSEAPTGKSVEGWLQDALPSTPLVGERPRRVALTVEEITSHVQVAEAAGILERYPDGSGLHFAQRSVEAAFAALALEGADDGTGPLAPRLLRRAWWEPTLIWAGIAAHPADLASRLLSLASGHATRAPGARGAEGADGSGAIETVALALAAALTGIAPRLEPDGTAAREDREHLELAQERLRDLLDRVQALVSDQERRPRLVDALSAIERDSSFDLVAQLVAIATAAGLGRLLRAQTIEVLGAWASPAALDALVALLGDTEPVLRQATAAALALAGPAAVTRLCDALSSPDEGVRARATEALSRVGSAAIPTLVVSLEEADPRARAAAARALGTLGAHAATEALTARLDDPSRDVRAVVAWALGQVGTRHSVPVLEAHLATPDPALRAALAEALGSIHHSSAFPALVQLLGDPDAQVRAAAAEALGRLGDERAVGPLRERLGDRDRWAQAAAATALRRLGVR